METVGELVVRGSGWLADPPIHRPGFLAVVTTHLLWPAFCRVTES